MSTNEVTTKPDGGASVSTAGLGLNTAAMTLERAGVYAGAHGLEGLANAVEFWDQQPYGTRLYYGPGPRDYLQSGVLKTAVRLLAEMRPNVDVTGTGKRSLTGSGGQHGSTALPPSSED